MMNEMIYSRKKFLKLLGASAVAFSLPNFACAPKSNYVPKIGFQLYTVRKAIEKDFEGTIKKIAEMGYAGVETYPLPKNITLEQAAKVFKENGIEVFGMHTEIPTAETIEEIAAMAEIYQSKNAVYHGWPGGLSSQDTELFKKASEIFNTEDKVKQKVEEYNNTSLLLKNKGLVLGLHNHWFEFENVNGIIPFYYFLEHLDKEIFFEIDTYWVKTAGQNPAKVLHDFGKRAPFLHIKDGPATKDENMYAHVPMGKGSQDFPSIVKAGGENIQWMIVEFDEYSGDIIEGMQTSYTFLTKNNLAKGKI